MTATVTAAVCAAHANDAPSQRLTRCTRHGRVRHASTASSAHAAQVAPATTSGDELDDPSAAAVRGKKLATPPTTSFACAERSRKDGEYLRSRLLSLNWNCGYKNVATG